MPANYVDKIDAIIPAALETNLMAALPSGTVNMINQLAINNPAGSLPGKLPGLSGIASATDGRIFLLCGNGTAGYIVEISAVPDARGVNARVVAGLPGTAGNAAGTGIAARFGSNCLGMVWLNGTLYVCDVSNNNIKAVNTTTYVVTIFAGSTAGTAGQADGTGTAATLNGPRCICTDGTNLYVGQSAGSPAPSLRQIVAASGVVTTLSGTAHSTTTARVDSITCNANGSALYYTEAAVSTGTSWLFLYRFPSTRVTITGSTLNAGTGTMASGLFALNTTNPGGNCALFFQNVSAIASICADPVNPAVLYIYNNANTASSGSTNKIYRVRLLPDIATATVFEIAPFAFNGGNTPGVVEGVGQTAGPLVGTNATFLAPSAAGGALLLVDGVAASDAGRLWAVDIQDQMAALLHVGSALGSLNDWNTSAGRTLYASVSVKRAGDANNLAYRRLVSRLPVAPGETVLVDVSTVLEAGDLVTGLSLNGPAHIWVPVLEET